MTLEEILFKFWGHNSFRPNQRDVIHAAIQGYDVIALLPTGGGKSICFQVPALAMKGICLVISPLISLMKDQIDELKKKGIRTEGLFGSKTKKEVDIILDNCIYGDVKFLYLAPERLKSEIFIERLKKMNVCLIAIDEAHCISQWGHDFRPSYLDIPSIKPYCKNTPLLALTATATPKVTKDIEDLLRLKNVKIFKSNLKRTNLTYRIRYTENKIEDLKRLIKKEKGTGIIYVNYRRTTTGLTKILEKIGASVDYYHGGLQGEIRFDKQEKWISGETKIMVATNAFGMGIDKADVRFVIHYDLPISLEGYYQEVGRAGRDGEISNTYLLFNEEDILRHKKNIEKSFPPKEKIRKIYQSLCNFFHLAIGAGMEEKFELDLNKFCEKFGYKSIEVFSAIKILELNDYLSFAEGKKNIPKIQIITNHTSFFRLKGYDKTLTAFLEILLRSYPGIFENPIGINEFTLSKRSKIPVSKINHYLQYLKERKIISYQPRSEHPTIFFINNRIDAKNIIISKASFDVRKQNKLKNLIAIERYVKEKIICRSKIILKYFGEEIEKPCNKCDICLKRIEEKSQNKSRNELINNIILFLKNGSKSPQDLLVQFNNFPEEFIWDVVRELLDWGKINKDEATGNLLISNLNRMY